MEAVCWALWKETGGDPKAKGKGKGKGAQDQKVGKGGSQSAEARKVGEEERREREAVALIPRLCADLCCGFSNPPGTKPAKNAGAHKEPGQKETALAPRTHVIYMYDDASPSSPEI